MLYAKDGWKEDGNKILEALIDLIRKEEINTKFCVLSEHMDLIAILEEAIKRVLSMYQDDRGGSSGFPECPVCKKGKILPFPTLSVVMGEEGTFCNAGRCTFCQDIVIIK